MINQLLIPIFIFLFLSSPPGATFAQENGLPYTSEMADLGDIQLEYKDFGGEGLPLIWVQDFHNYFEGPYLDTTYFPFFAALAKDFRVLAPIRRGYGKSTDTQWGYDVATQSEDLLHFLDAMDIERAVLFGRLPANQDITWIAEHHPDRLAGLIYWGNPIIIAGCGHPDELGLIENWSAAFAPDFEKEKEKRLVMSRAFWRPHFLWDTTARIDVPAMRFFDAEFDLIWLFRRLVESGMLEQQVKMNPPGREEEIEYLRALTGDSARYANLKEHLVLCDFAKEMNKGMERAFGAYLQTVRESELSITDDDFTAYMEWLKQHIRTFMFKIEAMEKEKAN